MVSISKDFHSHTMDLLAARFGDTRAPTFEEVYDLVHDLQACRFDLERQNEELRRAKQELEQAVARQQAAEQAAVRAQEYLDIAGVMLLVLDEQGRIAMLNRRGYEVLGYEEGELIGRNWFDTCVPQRIREEMRFVFRQLLAGGIEIVGCHENPLVTQSGEVRDFVWHSTLLKDSAGTIVGTLSSGEDITERKRAEEAMNLSEEKYRSIFENSPEMIMLLDAEAHFLEANGRGPEWLGYDEEELRGKHFSRLPFWSAADKKRLGALFARRLSGEDIPSYELEFICKDGRKLVGRVHGAALKNESGEISHALMMVSDVTQQKQVEAALENNLAFVSTLFETIPIPIYCKDLRGRYLGCNRAFEELLGRTREQIVGRTVHDVLTPQQAEVYRRNDEALLRRGLDAVETLKSTIERPDGAVREVVVSKTVYLDVQGQHAGIVGSLQDITDLREAQRSLRQRESELAHISRVTSMGEMAATLAHELNQPLHAIANYAHGTLRRMARVPSHLPEFVEVTAEIAAEAQRASHIIERLRGYLRKRGARVSTVSVTDVVRQVMPLLELETQNRKVAVEWRLTDNLPPVAADAVQLQQVVMNLAQNALVALGDVEPNQRRLAFATHRAEEEGFVEIAVSDSGPGVPEDVADRIFDAFFTTKTDGLGMGLAICRRIIETHGGKIRAEANSPRGAVFRFTLPILSGGVP